MEAEYVLCLTSVNSWSCLHRMRGVSGSVRLLPQQSSFRDIQRGLKGLSGRMSWFGERGKGRGGTRAAFGSLEIDTKERVLKDAEAYQRHVGCVYFRVLIATRFILP